MTQDEVTPEMLRLALVVNRIAKANDLEESGLSVFTEIKTITRDSLDYLLFLQRVEEEFQTEIPNSDLSRFLTVGDVARWLEAHA